MTDRASADVTIVGGGFAGTMLAAQLARRSMTCVLVDGSGRIGLGTAYSTRDEAHLLNIPADRMSAWPEDLDDFARVIEAEGGSRFDFVQRRRFGDYMRAIRDTAVGGGKVSLAESYAIGADRTEEGWRVTLEDGRALRSRALALAAGNQQPQRLRAFDSAGDRYVADPWSAHARDAIGQAVREQSTVVIVGTGLTMVDTALSLDSAGHRGRIVAMSRRGLLPRANNDGSAGRPVADRDSLPMGDLRAMVRWIRQRGATAGWREAIDSLRPHSHDIWRSLDRAGQRRFLRHARAYWDVHRHRIAPEVARTIAGMIGEGRLEVMAARITHVEPARGGLSIRYRRRGQARDADMDAGVAFNCTGPLHAMSSTRDPLLRDLLTKGYARPDALDIGLEATDEDRVVGGENLWALGALTKSRYWEIIAVPDIRVQAAAVADDMAKELGA